MDTVYGLSGLQNWAKAQDLALNGADFTPVLRQCEVAIRADVLLNFQGAKSPDGVPWPPLARPRPDGSSRPLLDRGLLQASVTARGKNSVSEINGSRLTMGSNLIYARTQQEGATIVPKNAGALTIPLTRQAKRKPAREWSNLFHVRGTNMLATAKPGKKFTSYTFQFTSYTFQFALVQRVVIPPRPFLGFGDRLINTLDVIVGNWVEKWESK